MMITIRRNDDCFECVVELDAPPRAYPAPTDDAPSGGIVAMPAPRVRRGLARSVKARPFLIASGVFVCCGLMAVGLTAHSGRDSGASEHNVALASHTLDTAVARPYRLATRDRDPEDLAGQEPPSLRPTPTPPMDGPLSENSSGSRVPSSAAGAMHPPSFGMPD